MVLPRGVPMRIWGRAEPHENVAVKLHTLTAKATADADGQWTVALPAQDAGGPYIMEISGQNTLRFDDVLVGEVWVA